MSEDAVMLGMQWPHALQHSLVSGDAVASCSIALSGEWGCSGLMLYSTLW
jgi:hypothetical protein